MLCAYVCVLVHAANVADSNGGGFWAVDTGARFTFNGCVFQVCVRV